MKKKYVVKLTIDQREHLHKLISRRVPLPQGCSTVLASCSRPMSVSTPVAAIRHSSTKRDRKDAGDLHGHATARAAAFLWAQGLDAALERSMPDRVYKRSFDGRAEARLIALACSEPPEGREHWSLRLLADKAVELGIVEEVSHETIRKTLKKTNFGLTWSRGDPTRTKRPVRLADGSSHRISTKSPTIRCDRWFVSTRGPANSSRR